MKVFILCGGLGTRLDGEGLIKPKAMIKIGNYPILRFIILNFYNQGFRDFVFCTGYKSDHITNYFIKQKKNYTKIISRSKNYVKFKYVDNSTSFIGHLIYTGIKTGTGGRILISYNHLKLNEDILMTYCDGLSNVNIKKLLKFHYLNKAAVTLTAVRPKHRYGIIKIKNKKIYSFANNNPKSEVYVNGGFFVISKNAIKKIKNIKIMWEKEPINYYVKIKKLYAFKHNGFWKSLDTLKDKNDFNKMIMKKRYPWMV
jgi:glucose-1-phosphate cytidylyltransferase